MLLRENFFMRIVIMANVFFGKSIMANVTEPIGIWNTQYQNMEHLWGFGTLMGVGGSL